MIRKIKESLTRGNLLYKIIALVLAVLLWLSVNKPFDGTF